MWARNFGRCGRCGGCGRRGLTLLEMTIVCLLMSLLGAVLVGLMGGVSRVCFREDGERAQLLEGQRALARLVADLGDASGEFLQTGPGWMVVAAANEGGGAPLLLSGEGQLRWCRWLGWACEGGRLWRSELPIASAPVAPAPVPALSAFAVRSYLGREVRRLDLVCSGSPTRLVALALEVGSKGSSLTLQSSVALRNGGAR